MSTNRRAVVLLLDGATGQRVDEIRLKWDPVMTARIPAHITLVHDIVDHELALDVVAAAAHATSPFRVTLTSAACWGPARYGVYLDIDDVDGGVGVLHRRLAGLESPGWARVEFRPHVTLVHGRTVTERDAEAAWSELDGYTAGWPAEIASIDIVELREPRWRMVERYPFRPRPSP